MTPNGDAAETFREWAAHPEPDAFWDRYNPTAEQYARMTLPVLTLTGSYDDDQPGALKHYQEFMQHASADAKARRVSGQETKKSMSWREAKQDKSYSPPSIFAPGDAAARWPRFRSRTTCWSSHVDRTRRL